MDKDFCPHAMETEGMAAPGHIKHEAVGGSMSADSVHKTASLQSLEHDFCGLQVGSVGFM